MIRSGTTEDIPEIVEMAREFWKETIYKETFDPETVEAMSQLCIDQGLMCVVDIGGKLEGFACGVKGALLANSEVLSGTEVAWWVNPDHRQGKNGIGLLMALEKQAKEQGIKYWNMAYMQSSMPEKIEGIYKRLGYERAEVIYAKVI
jgi:N-acetylglutamate synthase-like GNAT family acetyltransferase